LTHDPIDSHVSQGRVRRPGASYKPLVERIQGSVSKDKKKPGACAPS